MNASARELRELMRKHTLSRSDVAAILDVARSTVNAWLSPDSRASARQMPPRLLTLLRHELSARRPSATLRPLEERRRMRSGIPRR